MLKKAPDTCWGYFNDGFMGDVALPLNPRHSAFDGFSCP
jgi:hypothetical protein